MSKTLKGISLAIGASCIFAAILFEFVTSNAQTTSGFCDAANALAFSNSSKISSRQAYELLQREVIRLNATIPEGEKGINAYPSPKSVFAVTRNGLFFFPAGSLHHLGLKWTKGYFVNPENGNIKFEPVISCTPAQVVKCE
jgi:hypothetical protein